MSGHSIRVAGHFGEVMQGRLGADGPVALITLPCPVLGVTARLQPGQGLSLSKASAAIMPKARAVKLLQMLGLSISGELHFSAEMPPGGGAGVSTAALVALARLAGWQGDPLTLARACVAVEGASDPLMLAAPMQVLWASRIGQVLDSLPPPPAMEVIGGFYGPPRRTDPADMDFPDIADLVPLWHAACLANDLAGAARVASLSASRSLAQRGARSDPTLSLAADLGALGCVIAHTGAARGLIFAPGAVPARAHSALQAAGLRGVVQFRAGGEP
ncbi:propanediol utilization protein [Cypionkella sinensis]|uniref:Propanediol utilization protein n=1 Tax=Cypionkella sinensis TaxID=1756043 RepID=A0ABV7J1Q5_9RHOB